ncbi:MAG: hypothetical protein JXR76_25645 [Deltaproteobacteria bacterium]|nr:hypothetical protein [Deltaproteobacteria bacterium]
MKFRKSIIPAVVLITLFTNVAIAEEAAEEKSYGVNVDLGFATIYNFRGVNTFAEDSQMDQNGAFFPSVTWSIGETGLYLGYWGAYQLSGNNISENVTGALGHEQDLYIGWDKSFGPDDMMTFSVAFTYFFYPFAKGLANNGDEINNPSIVEPLVGFSLSSVVDLGLTLSYFAGVDDSTSGLTHLYIKPSIGKSVSFGERFGLDMGFGAGFKVWKEDIDDNVVDLSFDFALPIALEGSLYASPSVSLAWTNFEKTETGAKIPAGKEYMVYAGLNIGADF